MPGKAEVIDGWAARAGGYSDELTEAFAGLSGPAKLTPNEIEDLLKLVPKDNEARFAKVVRSIPATSLGAGGSVSPELLRALAANPAHGPVPDPGSWGVRGGVPPSGRRRGQA